MMYSDSTGRPVEIGDRVSLLGWPDTFEIVTIRPERVAVIRNVSRECIGTSSVPLASLTVL